MSGLFRFSRLTWPVGLSPLPVTMVELPKNLKSLECWLKRYSNNAEHSYTLPKMIRRSRWEAFTALDISFGFDIYTTSDEGGHIRVG